MASGRGATSSAKRSQSDQGDVLDKLGEEFGIGEGFAGLADEFGCVAKRRAERKKRETVIDRTYDEAGPIYSGSRPLVQPDDIPCKKGNKSRQERSGEQPPVKDSNAGSKPEVSLGQRSSFEDDALDFGDEDGGREAEGGSGGQGVRSTRSQAEASVLEDLRRGLEEDLSLLVGLGQLNVDDNSTRKLGSQDEREWSHRRRQEYAVFTALRTPLAAVRISGCAVPSQPVTCSSEGCDQAAQIRCKDCRCRGDAVSFFCSEHDEEAHPFAHKHEREAWCNGFWEALPVCSTVRDGRVESGLRKVWSAAPVQCRGCKGSDWKNPRATGQMFTVVGLTARADFLTEVAIQWCGKKVNNQALYLVKRYARTEKQAVEILAKLDEVCLPLLGLNAANVPVDAWDDWTADVIEAAERQRARTATDKKDELEYFQLKTAEIASATVGALLTALPEERVSMCSADVTAIRDQAETLRAAALKKTQRLRTLENRLLQKHSLSRSEGDLNLLDALSKELFESVLVMRQEELEATLHQISRLHAQLKKESSSAKERRSLRKRIEKRNSELKVQVLNYNRLVPYGGRTRSNADAGALLRGDPEPWRFEGAEEEAEQSTRKRKSPDLPNLSLKEKLSLLDVYNLKNRLEEESVLLVQEMLSYLTYFKGYISDVSSEISGLYDLIDHLESFELADFDLDDLDGTGKYSITDENSSINKGFLAGRVALLCQGRRRAQRLLSKGVESFTGILSVESMRSVLEEVKETAQADFDPEIDDPELTDEDFDSGSEDSE